MTGRRAARHVGGAGGSGIDRPLDRQRLSKPNAAQAPAAPGPWLQQTLAPRPAALVRDYTRHVGGDPRAYRGQLPPHLFPQWGFPLLSRTLHGISYPIERVLNGGCGVTFNAPIPDDAPVIMTEGTRGA